MADVALFLTPLLFLLVFYLVKSTISDGFLFSAPLIFYQLIFSTFIGVLLVYLSFLEPIRLESISDDTKETVFVFVFYSVMIILIGYCLFIKFFSINSALLRYDINVDEIKTLIRVGIFFIGFYTLFKFVLNYSVSPLVSLIKGDFVNAALLRAAIQKRELSVDLAYIGKIAYLFCFYLPIASLYTYLGTKNKVFIKYFIISLIISVPNLMFDIQKAPMLILVMGFFFAYIQFYRASVSMIIKLSLLMLFLILFYGFFMGKEGGLNEVVISIMDRLLVGQNQGMYYFYQYYPPSLQGVFSDLPFSELLGVREPKPDELILPYIYKDLTNLVNSNTFFIGEAWAFFSWEGVFIVPWIVVLILSFYLYFFRFLIIKNHYIWWPASLVFFATIPINQSLQFILYQKYFFYFLFFLIIPIIFIKKGKLS